MIVLNVLYGFNQFNGIRMSQTTENIVKKCEVVVDATNNVQIDKNSSSNTLKSVRKKIRSFTIRRKAHENFRSDSIGDQKDMNQDKSSDESLGKSKITFKKIFRKSSFKKFISNFQHFTNFTVSGLSLAFIHSQLTRCQWKEGKNTLSIVKRIVRREGNKIRVGSA